MIYRIFEYLLQISLTENHETKKKFSVADQFILWIYFSQLNGFLVMDENRNSRLVQENQYLFTILQYANIITEATKYFSLDFLSCAILLFIIVIFVAIICCSIIKLQQIRIIKVYFVYFNWILLCPLQTIFIQASTQRKIFQEDQNQLNTQNNYLILLVSIVGTILVLLSSIISTFFYQKREIHQNELLKYDFLESFMISPLIICYIALSLIYQQQESKILYIHAIHFVILVMHLRIGQKFVFGLTPLSILFNQITILSILFNMLLIVWKVFAKDDKFIFLTFFISSQLLWYTIESLLKREIKQIIKEFCISCNLSYLVQSIDYFICEESQGIELVVELLIHKNNCFDVLCPCKEFQNLNIDRIRFQKYPKKQKVQNKFILKKWILHIYKNQLKGKAQNKNNKKIQELIILNYLSFQKYYLENDVLTCKTIYQSIEVKQQIQKSEKIFDVTKTILYLIWQKCRFNLMSQSSKQIKITQQEYFIIMDINILQILGDEIIQSLQEVLRCQKLLWARYQRNQFLNFDSLLRAVDKVQKLKVKSKQQFEEYQKYRNQTKETIYSLKIKFLFYLIIYQDLRTTLQIQQQLNEFEQSSQYDINVNEFNNLSFLTGQALSIISNISPENQGKLEQKVNAEFKSFFGFSEEEGQQLTHIHYLMPNKIGEIHSGLVENFFFKGQSERINNSSIAFILNKKNLIEQVKLCLSYFFPVNLRDLSFYMVAHIQKTSKIEQNFQDQNLKGHLILDKDFKIFGMTQNIYEKLNYKVYFKQNQDAKLIEPEEIYKNCNIFCLIPQLKQNLQNYYEKMQGTMLKDNEVIFFKEKSLMKIDLQIENQKQTEQKSDLKKLSLAKLTNKKLLLHVIEKTMKISNQQTTDDNIKYYPIEFTVTQKLLHPYSSQQNLEPFLYYLIEIEFLEDFKQVTEQKIKNKQFLKWQQTTSKNIDLQRISTQQYFQFESVNVINSDNILSPNGEELQIFQDTRFSKTKRQSQRKFVEFQHHLQEIQSQNSSIVNIPNRVHKFYEFLKDDRYPSVFMATYGIISIHILMILFSVGMMCFVYFIKKVIQSDCITNSTEDANYFNGYSLILSGYRQIMYHSNFQSLIDPVLIQGDDGTVNITSKDRINISWHILIQGSHQVLGKFQNYSKILLSYDDVPIDLYYPDLNNQIILSQKLNNYAIHYTTLYQEMFLSIQNDSSLNKYLFNIVESNLELRNRYFLYFNYLNIISLVNSSLFDCDDYNYKINQQYDQLAQIIFILLYCIALLFGVFNALAIKRLKKVIQIFLKQFISLEFNECEFIINSYELLQESISQDNILLKQHHFEQVKQIPTNILALIQFQDTNSISIQTNNQINSNQKIKSLQEGKKVLFNQPTLSIKKFIILYILLIMLKISFTAVFQIYYDYVSSGIAPVAKKEIEAQLMRVNFILTINMWDTYLLKQFYILQQDLSEQNNYINYSYQNIKNNQQLLNLMKIDKNFILNQIQLLQQYDLTDFLYRNAQQQNQNLIISEENKQILIGKDVCLLIGCNMSQDLLQNRTFQDQLIEYYQVGLIQLIKNTFQVIIEYNYLLTDDNLTDNQRIQGIFQMHNSNNYLLYIFYGLDATQYQISQFCQYFQNLTKLTFNQLTESNIIYILIFGIPMFIFTLFIEMYVIKNFSKNFDLGRESIRQIPLDTLFYKGIPKKLCYLMKKYK